MNDVPHEASGPRTEGEGRRQALFAEYGEVCDNFRMLTDIRFRLLAFLPIASGAALVAALVTAMNKNVPDVVGLAGGLALSLFGLVATIGLATYNARNDELYFALVARAAAIERELDLPDGAFANRPGTWQRIALLGTEWEIDHGTAVRTIYGASIALWLFGTVALVLESCRRACAAAGLQGSFPVEGPRTQASLVVTAILISVAVPLAATLWGAHQVKVQKKERQKEMKRLAREAIERAEELRSAEVTDREEFLQRCAADEDFRGYCADLAEYAQLSSGANEGEKQEKRDAVMARARFYEDPDARPLGYYVPMESEKLSASYLIGLLTDLSPLWIYDLATNRKGDSPLNHHETIPNETRDR